VALHLTVFRDVRRLDPIFCQLRLQEQGQAERHLSPLAETAYCLDAPTVRLDDNLGYG
jgi:hypothetical protein